MKKFLALVCFFAGCGCLFSQEALLSHNEKYYEFLVLGGYAERDFLNFRTLSDSTWDLRADGIFPWAGENIGSKKSVNEDFAYRIYGPEVFASYNTEIPYGQNDSTLWQGKGLNSSVRGGARIEFHGFEATFFPNFAVSQNRAFDMFPPAYSSGEAAEFGYYGTAWVDAPQRFGDDPHYEFSWGDSEIRYTWKTFTLGFGTQHIWLGPAKINPILLSNNAAPYPKLDIGVRRQPVTIFDTYLGDLEARAFWGRLSESDFFDDDDSNDHTLLTGLALAYAPSFAEGFSVGMNRIMLANWKDADYEDIGTLIWVPSLFAWKADDSRDQRTSFIFDYILPNTGFEIYFEWARNDFSTDFYKSMVSYPFHTQAYTFGLRKQVVFGDVRGELSFEMTNLESSRNYDFIPWDSTFYAHHTVIHGHTNRGQWLGAGIGTGGNSQYLGYTLFYKKGYAVFFVQRQNIDSDYYWYLEKANKDDPNPKTFGFYKPRGSLSFGINNYIRLGSVGLSAGILATDILYANYKRDMGRRGYNYYASVGINYIF